MVPKDGLSLKDLLRHFLDFRLVTVTRRFEYQLRQLRQRIHILEGFAIIFNALDQAIKIIRNSSGKPDAADKLKAAFKLDDLQVTAILDSQLYKIAQMEIQKILDELKEKKKQAEEIEAILASKKKLWNVIKGEMEALIEKFPERRKTRMATDEDVLEFDEEAYIARENTNVVLTRNGWIKRVGRLSSVESTRVQEGDEVVAVVPGSTLDHVVFFADDGAAYTMRINEVPATAGYGDPITKFFKLGDGVKVVAAVTTDPRFTPADSPPKGDNPTGPFIMVCTRNGYVLRTPLTAFRVESTKSGRRYVKLEEGDKVTMVRLAGGEDGVMLATTGGYVTHFPLDQVTVLSGVGRGVIGIKLDPNDECVGGTLVGGRFDKLVLETENGKTQDFGPGAIKSRARGAKGDRPGQRTRFVRVVPPPIELADWEAVDGKKAKDAE